MKETTGVVDFRQWMRTLDLCFEAHYDWKCADLVVQPIRHEKSPITADTFADMIVKIKEMSTM